MFSIAISYLIIHKDPYQSFLFGNIHDWMEIQSIGHMGERGWSHLLQKIVSSFCFLRRKKETYLEPLGEWRIRKGLRPVELLQYAG